MSSLSLPDNMTFISGVNLGDRIDEGTYGKIFKGSYKEREVAIKIAKESTLPPVNEIFFLEKLHHPHIVEYIGLVQIQTKFALVMKLEKELSLSVTPQKKKSYAQNICSAYTYISALGVIHRDIKLNNILVTCDGQAKLSDFGLSCLDKGDEKSEQLVVRDRVDLGFVLHTLATGREFFCNALSETDELVTRISQLQFSETLQQDQDKQLLSARDICWNNRSDEKTFFITALCTALGIPRYAPPALQPSELYDLGRTYEEGKDRDGNEQNKDYERAAACYLEAAKKGDRDAQYTVGMKYFESFGGFFIYDISQAISWLEKAAEQGHLKAQKEIAHLMSTNDWGCYYPEKSLMWNIKAAEQGDLMACEEVGSHYYHKGKYIEAKKWLAKPGEAKWPMSLYYLEEIGKKIPL